MIVRFVFFFCAFLGGWGSAQASPCLQAHVECQAMSVNGLCQTCEVRISNPPRSFSRTACNSLQSAEEKKQSATDKAMMACEQEMGNRPQPKIN